MKQNEIRPIYRVWYAIALLLAFTEIALAQTNPTPQTLPYTQYWTSLAHSSTTYPAGWQGWIIGSSPGSTFKKNAPTGDKTFIASSDASTVTSGVHNYNEQIGFLNGSSEDLSLVLALDATGKSQIDVKYNIMTIRNPYNNPLHTRKNSVTLQYRIGTSGNFTTLTGVEYENNTTNQTTSITTPQNLETKTIRLPRACDNQSVLQLRWVSKQVSGSGDIPSFAIDNIEIDQAIAVDYPVVYKSLPTPINSYADGITLASVNENYTGGQTPAYSPSITSFTHTGSSNEWLVAAYVYKKDASHRTVGFARSEDGGASWSELKVNSTTPVTLPVPKVGSLNCTNLDEPQIVSIGGDTIVCVVRGWVDDNSASNTGHKFQEQAHSIYTRSGIFIYVSRDAGATWGYWNPNNNNYTLTGQYNFGKVITCEDDLTTVEHPRIAFRKGFDNKGYVVWQKKQWTLEGTNKYRVSNSEVGVRTFRATSYPSDGRLFGYNSILDVYFDFGVNGSTFKGPEKPSVAISPDKQLWIGCYAPDYEPLVGSVVDPDVKNGRKSPIAEWYLVNGKCTLNSPTDNSGSASFNFDNNTKLVAKAYVQGLYDAYRGYFYGYDSSAHDLSGSNSRGDIVDLASGPSVQVAVKDPDNCNTYHVGYLFAGGNGVAATDTRFVSNSSLNFYSAKLESGNTTTNWYEKRVAYNMDPNNDYRNPVDTNYHNCSDVKIARYFPILKYVNYNDQYLNREVFDNSVVQIPRSYFALAFMYSRRSEENDLERVYYSSVRVWTKFDSLNCRTAFSWDNENFGISKYDDVSNADVSISLVKAAEPSFPISTSTNCVWSSAEAIDQSYWGKQIDLSGEYGGLRVHPIWHHTEDNLTEYKLYDTKIGVKTNTAECIIIKPYLDDHFANDPEAFPTKFSSIDQKRFIETSLDYEPYMEPKVWRNHWSPYVYFNYKYSDGGTHKWIQRPTGATAFGTAWDGTSEVSKEYKVGKPLGMTQATEVDYTTSGQMFNGTASLLPPSSSSTSDIPAGIYYANYRSDNEITLGRLNFSNQRKFVTTGNVLHSVFERDGEVYYSMDNPNDLVHTPPESPNWIKVLNLNSSPAPTGVTRGRPSIAVYQAGDGSRDFCGKAAIGVTWREIGPDPDVLTKKKVTIKFRTREFNICTGEWYDWSDVYDIHSHTFNPLITGSLYTIDDSTTPVIAPLVVPDNVDIGIKQSNPDNGKVENVRTYLLGWTITWNSPKLILQGTSVEVDQSLSKFIYGLYSRSWLRTKKEKQMVSGTEIEVDVNVVNEENEQWGKYFTPSFITSCTTCVQPKTNATATPINANKVFESTATTKHDQIGFPTVVNSENKTYYENNDMNYRNEIAFSRFGEHGDDLPKAGIWHKSVGYKLTTPNIGSILTNDPTSKGTAVNHLFSPRSVSGTYIAGYGYDRNPCITMNSSGQTFVAWENMNYTYGYSVFDIKTGIGTYVPPVRRSAIKANHTDFTTRGWWDNKGKSKLQSIFSIKIPDDPGTPPTYWKYLLNPSITGFPKSHYHDISVLDISNSVSMNFDVDPAAVELYYWKFKDIDQQVQNKLISEDVFSEGRGNSYFPNPTLKKKEPQKGKGTWKKTKDVNLPTVSQPNGTNSQRSFGTYNGGPAFSQPYNNDAVDAESSFFDLDNKIALSNPFGNLSSNLSEFVRPTPTGGAQYAYKGTYLDSSGGENYSALEFYRDSVYGRFIWGDVMVGGDSVYPAADRTVKLHIGIPDTGYLTIPDMVDSIFQTEEFDWYPGTQISYYRGLFLSDSTSMRPGGEFWGSGFSMKFTVELITPSQIDTIESSIFSPIDTMYPIPMKFHIPNADTVIRDVRLRIRLSTIGSSIPDTMWQFQREFTSDAYPSLDDSTTIAYKRTDKTLALNKDQSLLVKSPIPNPSSRSQQVSVSFAATIEEPVEITVFDALGRQLFTPTTISSSGTWQTYQLPNIEIEGAYFIIIRTNDEKKVIPIIVSE